MKKKILELNPQLDQQAVRAHHASPPVLRKRWLTIGAQSYIAYDAHSLLAMTSEAVRARPGNRRVTEPRR